MNNELAPNLWASYGCDWHSQCGAQDMQCDQVPHVRMVCDVSRQWPAPAPVTGRKPSHVNIMTQSRKHGDAGKRS